MDDNRIGFSGGVETNRESLLVDNPHRAVFNVNQPHTIVIDLDSSFLVEAPRVVLIKNGERITMTSSEIWDALREIHARKQADK